MKKIAWFRVLPACLFLFWGSTAWAQAQRTQTPSMLGPAPVSAEAQMQAERSAAVQMKARAKAQAGYNEAAQVSQTTLTTADKAEIVAAQMRANQDNPSYDMEAALRQLKRYALYPLAHFDPNFPIVARTGNKEADRQALDQLLADMNRQ